MSMHIYSAGEQGVGAFDGGKFVEQRAISFPGEKTAVDRVGPLFYWAWGKASDVSEIGMHPHKAFEILTYVIDGLVEHRDSLGSLETVTNGGAQVIQAGSGVHHSEAFRKAGSEAMQIWFEPHLSETVKKPATYHQYEHDQFPVHQQAGAALKTVIGAEAPIQLDTDVRMYDWQLEPGTAFSYALELGRRLAFLVIRGEGEGVVASAGLAGQEQTQGQEQVQGHKTLSHKDFAVAQAEGEGEALHLQVGSAQSLRIIAIDVPENPGYALYRK
ncbi:pirin family protein [Paenibacillus qinlingensis]|uniref:Redox-sensitive bicupin YhaK (Pirin superfamily) n=1 Tax=Paenibacillus qinlingensis TaxID=1837343 RepID=A0ABU1NZ47_9BACL|nr:pirin family protein [Paenibacillus qinlingensis]MDR6552574.1 redox-sensitive bicupin YhaK (pirin superfamily) [Paenibacillus qinlingensis]